MALALALIWVVLARIPLVLNAGDHLDSDLAVDGLTLKDAVEGHWRWHYPATPYMGSLPILLSYLQARIWGANPITLVSGGVVAYACLVGATFALNRRAFGPSAAAWGLVPLAFASTGTIWLAGRITGGHLLTAGWFAATLALLVPCLRRGGAGRAAILGLWSGLGLYLDSMAAVSLIGLVSAVVAGWRPSPRPTGGQSGRVLGTLLAFGLALSLGVAPRFIGAWSDPHDAYREQFEPVTRADVLAGHAKILLLDCLPRLISGHRLPGLQAEPDPAKTPGASRGAKASFPWLGLAATVVSLALFAIACRVIAADGDPDPARRAVRWGLIASSGAVVVGFVLNRNIFNSDNYRYLVFLLVPWSSGFGLAMSQRAWTRPGVAALAALSLAGLMTADTATWYGRMGWLEGGVRPIRKSADDAALAWLNDHPETRAIMGDYWDVYRLAFLTGGRVLGVPFPEYPDRFPEIARGLPGGRPRTLIVRPGPVGPRYRARALAEGGGEIYRAGGLSILDWPTSNAGAKP